MERRPIKVLQIMGKVASGGVEAVIMNYYRHIDRAKVQFDFVMHKGADPEYIAEVRSMGARVYEITHYSNPIGFMIDVYKIVRAGKYSIIHSNMNALSVLPLFAAWLAGAKVRILHNHTTATKAEPLRTLIKQLLRPFARLFANQYWACSSLAGEWMYGRKALASGKVMVINNAIDLHKFTFSEEKRHQLRQELGLEDNFVIGHVGRFMKQKNHDFLLDIFAEIIELDPTAKLLLIGEGPLRQHIEAKVQKLRIAKRVIFTGIRSDVHALYNMMDVFVLPSYYEGLCLVGIEAQTNGLQYFVSDNITREVEVTNLCHFMSLTQDAKAWASAIREVKGTSRQDTLQQVALAGFDIQVEVEKLQKSYLEMACCAE